MAAAGERLALVAFVALTACTTRSAHEAPRQDVPPDPIAALRPYEEELRRSIDFAHPPNAESGLGSDPWTVRRVEGGWLGTLRGRSAVVALDEELRERKRVPGPRASTGLTLGPSGEVFACGDATPSIFRYTRDLVQVGEIKVDGVKGLRDVAVGRDGTLWATDERGSRLLAIAPTGAILRSIPVGHMPAQIVVAGDHVLVDSVTEHQIVVVPPKGDPIRIRHDGPAWGIDAVDTPDGLVVVAGAVEDHPLDRRGGFFGYIDSFVFAYRVRDGRAERIASVDVAELGVVTPKALAVDADLRVLVTAYGSPTGARLDLRTGTSEPVALVPGIRSVARDATRVAMADPLLDAWVMLDAGRLRVIPVAGEQPRSAASRLGEALFFTTLMAPKNASTGALSRFTCETCHFEGYVDGRTHHTGRDDVHATTKPLVGLVGNRPHFSRALDPDLATIAHAEFRVAGSGNPVDPFFDVEPREHPWLVHVGVTERVRALDLRRALMRFLVDFSHRPNPATIGRKALDETERAGMALFRDRCESCHAARLSADDPASRVAFERWETMLLAEDAPIVWGSAGYQKTGVEPYVHADGARTPSLRRLYKKFPYFTNGSAKSVDEVLERMRFGAQTFHDHAPANTEPLDPVSRRNLAAFLDLL